MTIHPLYSASKSLVSYLESLNLGFSKIIRGFPEHFDQLKLGDGPPVVTLTEMGDSEWIARPPSVIMSYVDGGETYFRYVLGYYKTVLQVDLWASYRAQRDSYALILQDAFYDDASRSSDLWIDQEDYYSRPLVFHLLESTPWSLALQPSRGEWRHTFRVECMMDYIKDFSGNSLSEVVFSGDIVLSGVETEFTYTVE